MAATCIQVLSALGLHPLVPAVCVMTVGAVLASGWKSLSHRELTGVEEASSVPLLPGGYLHRLFFFFYTNCKTCFPPNKTFDENFD